MGQIVLGVLIGLASGVFFMFVHRHSYLMGFNDAENIYKPKVLDLVKRINYLESKFRPEGQ